MAPSTPAPKLVRWAFDVASPALSDASVASSAETTSSTLAFVSSQLVAHGFTRPPGLVGPLGGLGNKDQDTVVKCLMSLLNQRIGDMERTEELTIKLNTLSYDHERLAGMYKAAKERVANAQREAEAVKAKHAITTTTLNELQATHKQTNASLQRATSALQFARQTAQKEITRKEKEIERIMERWAKVASEQPKLSGTASGLKCANLAAGTGVVTPKANPALETSLANLRTDREHLVQQNEALRDVIISLATGLDKLTRRNTLRADLPSAVTDLTVFPSSGIPWKEDAMNARQALHELLLAANAAMDARTEGGEMSAGVGKSINKEVSDKRLVEDLETARAELEESKRVITELETKILQGFAHDQRLLRGGPRPSAGADECFDGVSGPHDKELAALAAEKDKVTAAAIQLGKERAVIAAERLKLQEEKRVWSVQQILADMPDTPVASSSPVVPTKTKPNITVQMTTASKPVPSIFALPASTLVLPVASPSIPEDPVPAEVPTSPKSKTRQGIGRSTKAPTASGSKTVKPPKMKSPKKPVSQPLRSPKKKKRIGTTTATRRKISDDFEDIPDDVAIDADSFNDAYTPIQAPFRDLVQPIRPPIGLATGSSSQPYSQSSTNPFDHILARSAQAGQSIPLPEAISPPKKAAADYGLFGGGLGTPVTESSSTPVLMPVPQLPKTPSPPTLTAFHQRGRRNPYAPAVPSPLSRILRMADSSLGESTAGAKLLASVLEEGTVVLGSPPQAMTLAEELGLGLGAVPVLNEHERERESKPRYTTQEKGKGKMTAINGGNVNAGVHKSRAAYKENAIPRVPSPRKKVVAGGGGARRAGVGFPAASSLVRRGTGGTRTTGSSAVARKGEEIGKVRPGRLKAPVGA